MYPSCNLSHQCQGPGGSGLLTLRSWASSFPSSVEFCPAHALPGRRRRRAAGGNTYSTLPLPTPSLCPPWDGAGISLEMPGMAQDSTWSQLVCRWRWPGREQEIPGTLLQPRAALSSSHPPAPEDTALLAPGWSGGFWGLVFLQRLETNAHGLPAASLPAFGCVRVFWVSPCGPGWLQRGWKCFPRGSRSCPFLLAPVLLEGTSAWPGAAAH